MSDSSYYNHSIVDPQQQQQLPPGWSVTTDPGSGRPYYFNQATGETSWFAPTPQPALPTPPPQDPRLLLRSARDENHGVIHHIQQASYYPPAQSVLPAAAATTGILPTTSTHSNNHNQAVSGMVSSNDNSVMAMTGMVQESALDPSTAALAATTTTRAAPSQHSSHSSTLVGTARTLIELQQEMITAQAGRLSGSPTASQQQQQQDRIDDYELSSFSAGTIADLVHLQREQQRTASGNAETASALQLYYRPVNVHQLSITQERDPQEPSRIETRLHALQEQLRRIAS